MKKINKEDRPTCSCGEKMTIVEYVGYYETFSYFYCGECEIDPDNYEADERIRGSYV